MDHSPKPWHLDRQTGDRFLVHYTSCIDSWSWRGTRLPLCQSFDQIKQTYQQISSPSSSSCKKARYQQLFSKNLIPWCKFFFQNIIYYVSGAKCGSNWAAKWTFFVLNRVRVWMPWGQSSSQLIPTHFSFQPLSNPIGGFHAHAIQKNHNHSPGPFNI